LTTNRSIYLRPTGLGNAHPQGLEQVDWRGRGGYVVAPPSRHASGQAYRWAHRRDLDTAVGQVPTVLLERLQPHHRQRPPAPLPLPAAAADPGHPYVRAALAVELTRVAAAPVGQRNRQLWESGRNLFNFVAAGALDHTEVEHGLLRAAEHNGLLGEEPRQTRRTIASARQVGLAHPRDPPSHRGSEPEGTGRPAP